MGIGYVYPEKFGEMLAMAKSLSNGMSLVRVDYYYIKDNIHFGEMITNKDDYSKEDKEPLEPVCKKHPKSLAWWYDSKQ